MFIDLLEKYGMLPFWVSMGAALFCLAPAWFRKSRRAAATALTVVWVAGLFYVPYFFYHYVGYGKAMEASGIGVVLDPKDREFYAGTFEAGVIYLALMGVTASTYTVLSWHRPRRRVSRTWNWNCKRRCDRVMRRPPAKTPAGSATITLRPTIDRRGEFSFDTTTAVRRSRTTPSSRRRSPENLAATLRSRQAGERATYSK
ncbi:MAG: hypothetical protein QM775_36560 [Pirellulales bacterium]